MCTNARWHWLQPPQIMCRPVVWSWSTHVQPRPEAEQSPTDVSNIPPYPLCKICSASFPLRWNFPFISQTPLQRATAQPTPHLQSPQYISRLLCFTHCQFILGSVHFQASCSACQFWLMLSLWWEEDSLNLLEKWVCSLSSFFGPLPPSTSLLCTQPVSANLARH